MNVIDEVTLPSGWTEGTRPKMRYDAPFVEDDLRVLRGDNQSDWTDGIREWLIAYDNVGIDTHNLVYRFYMCRYGEGIGFLLNDTMDFTSAADHVSTPTMLDHPIVFDGTNYRLAKAYDGVTRYILRPYDVVLSNNGLPVSATVDPLTGILTGYDFSGGGGRAGFRFKVPVTFADALYDMNYGPEVRSIRTTVREMKWPRTME